MGRAREIEIRVIPGKIASDYIKKHHYSGKVVNNSSLHFGCFLDKQLHGVLQYGPSIDKRKMMSLVKGSEWNSFLELNRMAFDEYLPRNSESFCIAKTMNLIKKKAPQVKWIISFADGTSCGDGTIYRASNFILTGITENSGIMLLPNGEKLHQLTLTSNPTRPRPELDGLSLMDIGNSVKRFREITGAKVMKGFQFRYIYFIDKKWRKRLTVQEIPFSRIDEIGGGMYKGEKISLAERKANNLSGEVDSNASSTLEE